MLHFIIINWFNRNGVWIWNRFRVIFNWKLWRVNLNITIINGMMIKYHHDSWNHTTGFVSKGTVFEGIWRRLDVTLSCCLSLLITTKVVEFIHIFIRLGGINLGPHMMQASVTCPIFTQHSQIIFCIKRITAITECRVAVSLLMENEGPEWRERWPELFNVVGYPIVYR